MKHAGATALETLRDLLANLRRRTALIERRPGIFYVSGEAFLHFHEDPAGLFADLRLGSDWQRFPVKSRKNEPSFLPSSTGPDSADQSLVPVRLRNVLR